MSNKLFGRLKFFSFLIKKKKKIYFQFSEEDFRNITSGGVVKNKVYIDGEPCEVNIRMEDGIEHEEMSSIICENYYKSKWRM